MRSVDDRPDSPGQAREISASWGIVLLWALIIFTASAQSDLGRMDGPPWLLALRKCGHVVEYAVLALLVGRALVATWRRQVGTPPRALLMRAWRVGALICTLYAITDEFHQSLVPSRTAHVVDVAIDGLSATAALGIWYIVQVRNYGAGTADLERQ